MYYVGVDAPTREYLQKKLSFLIVLEVLKVMNFIIRFLKKMKPLLLKSLLASILCTSISQCANIIFDLGGVLIGNNKSYFMRKVGFYSFFMYLIRFNNPFSLRSRLFKTLDTIPSLTKNTFGSTDDNGQLLPDIMCDWIAGNKKAQEIRNDIIAYMTKHPEIFYNYSEQSVISQILEIMFTPELFVKSTKILRDGLRFVKRCQNRGHKVFVLSNWDNESFPFLKKKHKKLFSLFNDENIIISGDIGLLKPNPDIYAYIIGKYNLIPSECLFFDDQAVNVEAAKKLGIHGVVCNNLSYRKMRRELKAFEKEVKASKKKLLAPKAIAITSTHDANNANNINCKTQTLI